MIVDIIVLVILTLAAVQGYRRGLILSVFRLLSFAAASFLSFLLHPYMVDLLRGTRIFPWLKTHFSRVLNLDRFAYYAAERGQTLIENLPIPESVQNMLNENNTQAMRYLLRVDTIEDYVSGFFANLVLIGISILVIFIFAMVLLHFVGSFLDMLSRFPIVNTVNKAGGLAFGLLFGGAFVILILFLLNISFLMWPNEVLNEVIYDSVITSWVRDVLLQRLFEI